MKNALKAQEEYRELNKQKMTEGAFVKWHHLQHQYKDFDDMLK